MKVTIRQGVFETNSSSEHSLSIVKKSNFFAWKEGNQYARMTENHTDFEKTWGNFWSRQHYWEFGIFSPEEKDRKNLELFTQHIKEELDKVTQGWKDIDSYKSMPTGEDEYFESEDDKERFIEAQMKYLNERKEELQDLKMSDFKEVDKFYENMWITYDEYMKALQDGDCYSPFEHVNETEDVVAFGTYFHS